MKRIFLILGMSLLIAMCSNSMESDARRMAELSYRVQVNYQNNAGNDKDDREAIEFGNKMLKKDGKDQATKEKFDKLVKKEIKKLKMEK